MESSKKPNRKHFSPNLFVSSDVFFEIGHVTFLGDPFLEDASPGWGNEVVSFWQHFAKGQWNGPRAPKGRASEPPGARRDTPWGLDAGPTPTPAMPGLPTYQLCHLRQIILVCLSFSICQAGTGSPHHGEPRRESVPRRVHGPSSRPATGVERGMWTVSSHLPVDNEVLTRFSKRHFGHWDPSNE